MRLRRIPHPDRATKAELDAWVEQNILAPRREALAKGRASAKARRERLAKAVKAAKELAEARAEERADNLAALAKAGLIDRGA
jgi:hypothetical protein